MSKRADIQCLMGNLVKRYGIQVPPVSQIEKRISVGQRQSASAAVTGLSLKNDKQLLQQLQRLRQSNSVLKQKSKKTQEELKLKQKQVQILQKELSSQLISHKEQVKSLNCRVQELQSHGHDLQTELLSLRELAKDQQRVILQLHAYREEESK